jgi:AdoMet-dependent heme synthase
MSDSSIITPKLQLVAWEITRGCNLFCSHCRAASDGVHYSGELTTGESFKVVDQIAELGKPILILSGGEPLVRHDVYEIGRYAVSKGLRVVMGSNGTLLTAEVAARLKEIPLSRISVSLDFPIPELQDKFRGQKGAYDAAMTGIANARKAGIEIQINSTITKLNVAYLNDLLALAQNVGACAFHPFLLVPTGRGKGLESVALSPQEYEKTLNWIYDRKKELGDAIFFKPTCSPHFLRVTKQREKEERLSGIAAKPEAAMGHPGGHPGGHRGGHPGVHPGMESITRGCLAGTGFAFISHRGDVQGCGYFNISAGNVREKSFVDIWNNSSLFKSLRDLDNYKGKCGICEYRKICGGCRARAFEETGDYLEGEPYCVYEPVGSHQAEVSQAVKGDEQSPATHDADKKLLNFIQSDFPLVREPYHALGEKLGISEDEVISRIKEMKAKGFIRQISPVFDPRRLGYRSTLVAMEVPESRLELAEQLLVEHPGVSHGYERDHKFNLWFTLAIPPAGEIADELKKLADSTGIETVVALPATRLFKIGTYFASDDEGIGSTGTQFDGALPVEAVLSDFDKKVINGLQQDLPLVREPFAAIAHQLGITDEDLLARCRSLLERGIIRRFSASINHRRLGYTANAMTCWDVPSGKVDEAGKKIAALREVSHCYERETNGSWPYNLFAMIHARDEAMCRKIADDASRETGLSNYTALFSTKEFKKARIKYPV